MHKKRGGQALHSAASVLKDFAGWAIHDYWPAYYKFDRAQHGACNARISRELQGLHESGSSWSKATHTSLLELHQQTLPLQGQMADKVIQEYGQILSQAEPEEPPPEVITGKGLPKSTPWRNLLRRLTEHTNSVLAFALVEGVPFTNNRAEHDLRPAKVKQKVSGCFRTDHGVEVYARLQAAISTCRKQERNVFATLRNLFDYQTVSLHAGR